MGDETERIACSSCGRLRAQDEAIDALSWVSDRDGARVNWLCPSCARAHVRDIEGKLPAEYWLS